MFKLLVSSFCLLSLWMTSCCLGHNNNDDPIVVEKAIRESGGSISSSDLQALYKISQVWYDDTTKRSDAIDLYHHLADTHKHVMASAKLGYHYAEQQQQQSSSQVTTDNNSYRKKAIQYFSQAGELGPHHASLYNAGRLYAEQSDWVAALAFLRAAATLGESHPPEYVSESTTQAALEAYTIVSERIAHADHNDDIITIMEIADIFRYASLLDVSDVIASHWSDAIQVIIQVHQTSGKKGSSSTGAGQQSQDNNNTIEAMKKAVQALRVIWESYGGLGKLSELQTYLVLYYINDMLGRLVKVDETYLPMAAGYAEALASLSRYCWDQYDEGGVKNRSCFQEAAANAVSYYQQTGDTDSIQRVKQLVSVKTAAA